MNENLDQLWSSVFGYRPEGVFVIIDPQVGQPYGQLRALPLLVKLGLTRFTFASGWRKFDLVPFEYMVINEETPEERLVGAFPICQFISQSMEDASPNDVAKRLLMAHRAAGGKGLLVYVLDSERFMSRDSVRTKTFIDEYILKRTMDYESLFVRYCKLLVCSYEILGTGLTLNLALHRLAWEIGDAVLLRRLGDLFDYSRLSSTSWAWDLLERLVRQPTIREDEREISRLLHAWIDHDITRVGRRLFDKLQEFNFELAKIQAERRRLSEQGED